MNLDFAFRSTDADQDFDIAGRFTAPVTGIFGPSGAGKTTLLHLLAGIRKPQAGHLFLNDRALYQDQAGVYVPAHRRNMAVVFQDGRLFPHLSVAGNLDFGYKLAPAKTHHFAREDIIDLLELGPLLNQRPWRLSGGERQRVALGRAVLSSPKLLLLDEPLASLDRGRKNQILPFLRRIHEATGIPMIYISHDLTELLQLTDTLMVLDRGRAIGYGRFLDLVKQQEVLDLVHDLGLINVVSASVLDNKPREGIARLKPVEGDVIWTGPDVERKTVYTSLRPEDIALVKKPVPDISIQNQIPGIIRHVMISRHKALCIVDTGVDLLVEVTPHAVNELGLAAGQKTTCLFKAQALKYLA
ncbi:MAG: molybdenum ABC transporter ATP-binding protein [Acidobacteriota bacterium]|nr:molybdenum ABC transporter ATP-binding protein [Acidobacteriota bacterium]